MTKGAGDGRYRKPLPKTTTLTLTQTQGTKINTATFELQPDGKVWFKEHRDGELVKPVLANKEWVQKFDIGFRLHYDVAISLLKRWFEDWSD